MKTPLRPQILASELDLTIKNLQLWQQALTNAVPNIDFPIEPNSDADIEFWNQLASELVLASNKLTTIANLIEGNSQ